MHADDQLFLQLLYMFHTSAIQGLGRIADPTGKINKNLEYVKQTIDLMKMLKHKTKGNISDETKNILDEMIKELLLNLNQEEENINQKLE